MQRNYRPILGNSLSFSTFFAIVLIRNPLRLRILGEFKNWKSLKADEFQGWIWGIAFQSFLGSVDISVG
jgi:hypothetical protein